MTPEYSFDTFGRNKSCTIMSKGKLHKISTGKLVGTQCYVFVAHYLFRTLKKGMDQTFSHVSQTTITVSDTAPRTWDPPHLPRMLLYWSFSVVFANPLHTIAPPPCHQ